MNVAVFLTHPDVQAWCFSPRNRERLRRACPHAEVTVFGDLDAFLRALPEAEIAVTWTFQQTWFDAARRLKWLATPAAGKEYLAVDPPAGVRLIHGSFHGELIGETVVGLMLGHCRGLWAAARAQDLPWPRRELAKVMTPLRGAHVVIVGYGHVGRWIGRLLRPFGVRLSGVRQHPAAATPRAPGAVPLLDIGGHEPRETVVPPTALEALLPSTDHLVLALPGGSATDRLLDARRIALLPVHAAVYNVGRGNAIDEPALAAALRQGQLAAAYLDVFAEEPLPADSPLRTCPGLFRLPHVSAVAPNYLDLFVDELAARIQTEWS